jgi:hypothetical protein
VSAPPSRALLSAVPWLAGVLVLIVGVVLFPAGYMVWNATRDISTSGVDRGGAGLENFERVAALAALPRVLLNSAVWVIGVVLLTLTLLLSFTGYLLPWDQLALWAVTVGTNMMGYTPVFGSQVRFVLLGGVEIGTDTLLRWYVLHVLMFPFVIVIFMAIHFWRVRKDGGISGPL